MSGLLTVAGDRGRPAQILDSSGFKHGLPGQFGDFVPYATCFPVASVSTNVTPPDDFEGIFPDNVWGTTEGGPFTLASSTTVDGIPFSVSAGTMAISGRNAPVSGAPYNSALLFSNNDSSITADMTGVGPLNALGAWFGDINGSSTTVLTLLGTTGVLDVRRVTAGDMGLGSP